MLSFKVTVECTVLASIYCMVNFMVRFGPHWLP